jgi:hypothetical protein
MLQETQLRKKRVNFILAHGAVGDYCAWQAALVWVAETQPHVAGTIFAPSYFIEIPQNLFKKFQHWKVRDIRTLTDKDLESPTLSPNPSSPPSPTGASLIDLGFIYFTNTTKTADKKLPPLDLTGIKNPAPTDIPYAVMTPGATSHLRQMPPKVFNEIRSHLLKRGIMPVFLGREEMTTKHRAAFHRDYELVGINLVNKTTLLEAAKVIDESVLIVGLDNGLLHLAAMTRAPIIFGHNIIDPVYRIPRRDGRFPLSQPDGIYNVLPSKSIECAFCHSNRRFHFEEPNTCFTKKLQCLTEMTSLPYIEKIDEVLDGH